MKKFDLFGTIKEAEKLKLGDEKLNVPGGARSPSIASSSGNKLSPIPSSSQI